MSPNKVKTALAYDFFRQTEVEQRIITAVEIVAATGWSEVTVNTYRNKYWHFFLEKAGKGFKCLGLENVSKDAFFRLHSQRNNLNSDVLRPRFTPTVDMLLNKSRESALLAIQIYNNPLIAFRTPGYVVQMIIAFTSLFHAIFERNGSDYWYLQKDGSAEMIDGDKKAWEISKCITEYFGNKALPEIENLKFFVSLRNKIEHRFIPELDIAFAGKCQALLMNFEELLTSEFGRYFSLVPNLTLALQFSSYSSEQQVAIKRIQQKAYDEVRKFSELYDANLPDAIVQSMRYSFRVFLTPRIGNHAKSADVAVEFVHYDSSNPEEMKSYEKQVALIKERQISVSNKDNMKATQVAKMVSAKTGIDFKVHPHHTNAWKLYQVRQSAKTPDGCKVAYCQFDNAFKDYVYTPKWVEFLCEKVLNPQEFEKIKKFRSA